MITTTNTYKDLFEKGAIQEYKIIIDGVEYTGADIYGQPKISNRLFDKDTYTIGSFTVGILKVKLKVASSTIAQNAPVEYYYRYLDENETSEWVLKFTGKVSARTKQSEEVTLIEAKDAAANYDVFLDIYPDEIEEYPANTRVVTELCATHLGVVVDNIEDVYDGDIVEYPNELSIVEMLQNIAKLSGGNFIITEDNKLRIVITTSVSPVGTYGVQNYEIYSLLNPISKVVMYYSDENAYEQGDDSGSILVSDCLWATQNTTDYVYNILNGYEYVPMRSIGVYLDPAVQVGDLIEIDGVYQLVANVDWTFDGSCIANIETPQNNDDSFEEPYDKLVEQVFKRKVTLGDNYQGITISRDKGIEMLYSPDGTLDNATGRFYANLEEGIAMQYRQDTEEQWNDWLYFDKNEKVFKLALYGTKEELDEVVDRVVEIEADLEGINTTIGKIGDIESQVANLEASIDGLDISIKKSGGYNLIKNSVGYFDSDWDNLHNTLVDTEIQRNTLSHSAWLLLNKTSKQEIQIPNGQYTLSFKYRKLLGLTNAKVVLTTNEPHDIILTETDWTEVSHTFEVTNNSFEIALVSDSDDSAYVSDLIVAVGDLPPIWTMANGESITGNVKIGGGYIEITSEDTDVKQVSDSTGNRFYNTTTGEVVTEYTSEGMETKSLTADKGNMAGTLIVEIGDQTTLTRI